MKRLLAATLVLIMIVSLCACAKEPSAKELYALVMKKSVSADKIDSVVSVMGSVTIGAAGVSQEIDFDMTGAVTGENVGKEDMKMAMPMKVTMMDTTVETNMYFADGWYLMEMAGQKVKCPMDIETAIGRFTGASVQPLEYITLGEMTRDSTTGLYSINYTMDVNKAIDLSAEAFSMAGIDPSTMTGVEWIECAGTITTDEDGNLKEQLYTISFSTSVQGIDMECDMDLFVTCNDIANDFGVSVPDASEYTEVPPETLGFAAA